MNSDRHNKYNANNEDLGLFLPNSIIPDIMQELDGRAMKVGPSKLRSQQTYGMSLDSEPEKLGNPYADMVDRQQGLFTPGRKYNSHSSVGGYFPGRNGFAGPNFPVQSQNPNNWVNNNMNMYSNNYYSNNSNASGGYNSQKASLFLASNNKNSSNNSLRYNDTDYSSSNEMMGNYNTFNNINNDINNFGNPNNLNQLNRNNQWGFERLENSMANLSIGSNMGSMNGSFAGSMTGSNSLTSSMTNLPSLNGMNSVNPMNGLCNGMNSMNNMNCLNTLNNLNTMNTLNRPKKKGFSSGMVSHNYQGNFNKKPSFNNNNNSNSSSNNHLHLGNLNNPNQKKKSNNSNNNFREREDEEEDLETFLEELDGEVHTFICSQKGSRIMQKFLNKISPENLNMFIHKIGGNVAGLMTDLYGNYFCQKLFQSCSAEQRIIILNYISKDIVSISYDNSGTHALQSLLEIINLHEEEVIILEAVRNYALEMCYDNNATHVIQKLLVCICEEKRDFLNKIVLDNLKSLSLDCNGICVVKKLVNTNKSQEIKDRVIGTINSECLEIVQSPFGNYAIQHLIEEWGMSSCKDIVNILQQNIISLSMQKYSSNVVEKCLEIADNEIRRKMIDDIFNPGKLLGLLKNKYGSFVLQKAVNYLSPEAREEMKIHLQSRLNVTSTKEKSRINAFFESLSR